MKVLTLLLFLVAGASTFAQSAVVTYPVKPQNVTVCNGQSLTRIRIDFTETATAGGTITVALPAGMAYVAGSVVKTAGSTASGGVTDVTIAESGGTASSPQFTLSPASILQGSWIEFTLARTAGCDARTASLGGTIFKDVATVTVNGTANSPGASVDTGYTVNFPSLSFVQPVTQANASTGVTYTRNFTITNGADGAANAVHFTINYGTSTSQVSLNLAGTPLTPTSIVGSIYSYTLSGTQLGPDAQLTNGESLVFTENYQVTNACNPEAVTAYNVGWGCSAAPASWCQSASGTGTAVTSSTGSPNFSNVTLTNLNFVNMCTPWDVRLRLTNGGSGTGTAANMYNVLLQMGMDYYSNQIDGYNSNAASGYSIYNFRIGTATATMTLTGPAGNQTINFDLSQFTTDPDCAGVGLDDLDGDGFYDDLPQNAYIDLIYTYEFICSTACNASFDTHGPVVLLQYDTQCGQHLTSNPRRDSNYLGQNPVTSNNVYPPQVDSTSGNGFNISLGANIGYVNVLSPPDGTRYVWEVTMPAGVSIASSTQAYTQAGQIVTFTGTNISFFNVDNITFNYDCTSGQNLVFNVRLYRINDRFNNCQCRGNLICENITITAVCNGPCPGGGPWASEPQIRRADNSLGYVDYNFTTRVDPATLSDVQLKRALYKQQVQIKGKAVQTSATDNMHLEFVLDKATGGIDKLVPINAQVVVKRAGLTIGNCNYTTFNMSGSTATKTVMDLDLTNCFPSGTILINDEVEVTAIYEVATNNLPTAPTLAAGGKWSFYNYRADNTKAFCLDWIPQLYLLGTYDSSAMVNYDVKFDGCAVGPNNEMWERRSYSGGQNLFPGELIPAKYYDKIEVTIPEGYEYDHAVYGTARSYPAVIPSQNLVPATRTATTLTFLNDGSWIPSLISADQWYYEVRLQVYFRPTCATQAQVPVSPSYIMTYRDFYYANSVPVPQIPPSSAPQSSRTYDTLTYSYNQVSKPDIAMSNQTGTVQAVRPTESFTIRMASNGQTTAPYNWLALDNIPNVTITQVVDIATGTPIAPIAYANGNMYHLSTTGIASGAFKDYRIDFTYTTCTGATIKAYGGWNCGSFPASPADYLCDKEELNLSFITQAAEVEIISVTQPTAPFNLCEGVPYQFDINNAQAANVILNTFTVTVPQGMSPNLATFQVEYPKNSGSWELVTVTQTGNVFVLNLFEHTNFPVNGVPGTLLASNNDQRQMSIRWNMNTNCDFVSGSKFKIATYAERGCGQPAIGSTLDVETVSNDIAGADPGYKMLNTFSIASGSFSNCGSPVTIQNSSRVVLSGTTSTNAHILFEIPAGMQYVPNSFACTSAICPTFDSVITLPNGSTAVRLNIPAGLVALDELAYTIQVQEVGGSTCGNKEFILRTLDAAENLPCVTAPGGVCNFVAIQTGIFSQTVTITKPELAITAFSGSVIGNNYAGGITLNNTGALDQLASNPVTVNFYCADSTGAPTGVLLGTHVFAGTIASGTALTENFAFTATPCTPAGNIVAVLSNLNNCVCTTVQSDIMDVAVEICNNGIDDDGDGYTDAADPDCGGNTFCNDGGGVEIINETFGSGSNFGPALPAGTTNYIYSNTNADPPNIYIITNNPQLAHTNPNAWYNGQDHTANDTNGYMALFNGNSDVAGAFYSKTVTDLCPGVRYSFSSWITNVGKLANGAGPNPEVVFEIRTLSNVLIGAISTGEILRSATGLNWIQYGFSYDQPAGETAIKIIMRNNSTAIGGNDLAIDDIVLKACAPVATISVSPSPTVCLGSSVTVTGVLAPGYTTPAYQWQKSIDGGTTWLDIPGQTAITLTFSAVTLSDIAQYRLLASEAGNAGSINCASVSNVITLIACDNPSINVTKDGTYVDTNGNGITNIGDTVTYVFTVTNTGNVPLTNVTITDNNAVVNGGPISLAVGASDSTTFTAIHVITQADIDAGQVNNLALASGTPPSGVPVTDDSSDPTPCATCNPDPQCPTCTSTPLINATDDVINSVACNVSSTAGNILTNDTYGANPVNANPASQVTVSIISGTNPNIAIDANGNINVTSGIPAGAYTFTYQICSVSSLNTCDQATVTINVVDTTLPVWTSALPGNATVSCDAVPVIPVLTATDSCSAVTISHNQSINPGQCAGTYTIVNTWTATDSAGNQITHVQTITVQDTTAPVFVESLPANVTAECSAVPTAAILTATDNCGTATVSYSETSAAGTCSGNYTLTRTWIATDLCGLTTTHVQTITVQDTTAPVFVETLPANVTAECSAVPTVAILTATDNCGTATVSYSETSAAGTCSGNYTLTRTWIATDLCGLTTTYVQTIVVQDTTSPTFVEVLPNNIVIACDSDIPLRETLTALDNCSTPAVAFNEQIVNGNCIGNYEIIRTWTATDDCGNTTVHTQTITVEDTTAPVFVEDLPQDSFAECDKIPEAPTLTALDNCGTASVTYTETENAGDCSFKYLLVRTWTAADDCGNENSHTQTIQVACPVIVYNALSPNNDGSNDIFLLDGIDCYPNNRVEIFNRWGVSVFETRGYNNVDKVFRGYSDGRATVSRDSQLPTGTYFYVLSYEYQNGNTSRTIEKSGYLYINGK